MNTVHSYRPFGADSNVIRKMPAATLISMYLNKCNHDVGRHFDGISEVTLYECTATGMRFWRPVSVAGDGNFYKELSKKWPDYYKTDRWEYAPARRAISQPNSRVIEIGCGRGYFLKSLEPLAHVAIGLELNADAALNKVTNFEIKTRTIDEVAATDSGSFDAVCSFQVLEHVADPNGFIKSCMRLLRPGGRLILSTPNYEFPTHANATDAFDLPPHHLNHFTRETYKRMAPLLGLKLVEIFTQVNQHPRLRTSISAKHSPLEKTIRTHINTALRGAFGQKQSIGHTLLAVLTTADGT